jgi:lysyl-tRNA synthetase class 1
MTKPLEPALLAAAAEACAWPFEEARKLIKRLETLKGGADKTVIFETGYGPSGLPHNRLVTEGGRHPEQNRERQT